MSLVDALRALTEAAEWLADALANPDDLIGEGRRNGDGPGLPPEVSPAKKAENYWPKTERRPERAAAWPPFSGHRVPLGGET